MKNLFRISALALTLMISANVFAANILDVKADANSLTLKNKTLQVNKVVLMDEAGVILYSESSISKNFNKKLNISDLPSGTYFLKTENNLMEELQEIKKVGTNVVLIGEAVVSMKPQFSFEAKDKVVLQYNSMNENEKIISILNDNGQVLKTLVDKNNIVSKVFDFTKIEKGEYTVKIQSDGKVYYQTVNTK